MTNEHAAGKDNILAFLVQATNKHNLSIDITLNVNGAIVTGTIVSAKEYFVSLSESFEDGSEVAQQLSEKFAQAGEAIDSGDGGEASFIHLKDAKVFCGSSKPTPSKGEALWRGPLSDINGFYLDNIPDSAEEDAESDNGDYQSLKEKNSKLTDRIGKLEEMITKLSPDKEEEDKAEESEDEPESAEKQDSEEDTSKDDKEKEDNEKKRSGTKSSSTKAKKKSSSSKKTAKAE